MSFQCPIGISRPRVSDLNGRIHSVFRSTMDSFDNFQYDSASSYGGMGVLDDTSSVYTANTQDNASSVDLASLSLSEYNGSNGHSGHRHQPKNPPRTALDEDFDAVLDDLKDEAAVDLPPHACR